MWRTVARKRWLSTKTWIWNPCSLKHLRHLQPLARLGRSEAGEKPCSIHLAVWNVSYFQPYLGCWSQLTNQYVLDGLKRPPTISEPCSWLSPRLACRIYCILKRIHCHDASNLARDNLHGWHLSVPGFASTGWIIVFYDSNAYNLQIISRIFTLNIHP